MQSERECGKDEETDKERQEEKKESKRVCACCEKCAGKKIKRRTLT